MLRVLRATLVSRAYLRAYQRIDRLVESHFEEKFDYGAETSKRCKIAGAFVHLDVDFSRVFFHNTTFMPFSLSDRQRTFFSFSLLNARMDYPQNYSDHGPVRMRTGNS